MGSYIRRLSPRLRSARHDGDAASHPVQRRRHRLRDGGRHAGAHHPVRPLDRRGRRPGDRRGWRASRTSSPSTWAAPRPTSPCCRTAAAGSPREATVHGYPIKAPMLDIHTVGAGGGSIAHIDSRRAAEGRAALRRRRSRPGLLRQGQRGAHRHRRQCGAADAEPRAPAGRPHEDPPGSRRARDRAPGRAAGPRHRWQTAQGILSVVTANMARAIRVISVQRGHDPRDYTLMAFGGAGPLHAARLARELEIGRVLVPANPGILCAMGLLLTDLRADFAADPAVARDRSLDGRRGRGFRRPGRSAPSAGSSTRASRPRSARAHPHRRHALPRPELRAERRGARRRDHARRRMQALAAGFADVHRQRYGFAADGDPVQLVTLRLEATGAVRKAELKAHPDAGPGCARPPSWSIGRSGWRRRGDFVATPIYARERCARATASPAPPSSSRWTPRRWCRPA